MARRQASNARRYVNSGPFAFTPLNPKSSSSPFLSVALVFLGAIMLILFAYNHPGFFGGNREAFNRVVGERSCAVDVNKAIPVLNKVYRDSMHKVLHVGPDTCSVVQNLLKAEETEAWGVEPYDVEDTDESCKRLVRKGVVRVADIKFPLPYRANSFSLVIVSDALDYLSPKYLNQTLPEFARVASDGVIIFVGSPGKLRVKAAELSRFGRPAKIRNASWWINFFAQANLEENDAATKKFEEAAAQSSYKPSCQRELILWHGIERKPTLWNDISVGSFEVQTKNQISSPSVEDKWNDEKNAEK